MTRLISACDLQEQRLGELVEAAENKCLSGEAKLLLHTMAADLSQESRQMLEREKQVLERQHAALEKSMKTVVKQSQANNEMADKLGKVLTWHTLGRMALAAIPFAVVVICLAQIVGIFSTMYGTQPLFEALWTAFTHSTTWWAKTLWAVGALSLATGLVYLLVWLGHKLYEIYKRW